MNRWYSSSSGGFNVRSPCRIERALFRVSPGGRGWRCVSDTWPNEVLIPLTASGGLAFRRRLPLSVSVEEMTAYQIPYDAISWP
jgi:hypothetical protein